MNKIQKTVAAALTIASSLVLMAQADNVWTGAGADGLWTTATNWTLGVAPTNGQGNIIVNNQTLGNSITLGPGEVSTVDGDVYGPEWGIHLNIDGGSLTQLAPGFVFAPVGDVLNPSQINVSNGGYLEVQELLLGDNWWFGGGPGVDLTITGNSTVKSRGWTWFGGKVNLISGTLDIGGSINYNVSGQNNVKVDITGGTLIIRDSGGDMDLALKVNNAIADGSIVAYGGSGTVDVVTDINGYMLTAIAPAFIIEGSPTDSSTDTTRMLEAVIVDANSTYSSADMFLDGSFVPSDLASSGATNIHTYTASGLSAGVHTGMVIVVGISPSITVTNSWSFEVSEPPFESITPSPTGLVETDSPVLQAVVVELFSIVDSAQMFVDDVEVTPIDIDRSAAPTTTVSYAASGLSDGVHTGKVTVVGSPDGTITNEWTFTVVTDLANKPASLLHHWDFNETNGTVVADSIGSAHGTVIGSNHAWTNGTLDLFGGGISGDWNAGTNGTWGSYVDLPNGTISALPAATTFEAVFVVDSDSFWQRVWDFGNSDLGEDMSGLAADNIFLTPRADGRVRMELSSAAPGFENVVSQITDPSPVAVGQLVHVVVTYDSDDQRTKLFVNGVLVDADVAIPTQYALSSINDVNNWIGRAQYNDPMFDGSIDDMRIYSGIMTSAQVVERYALVLAGGELSDPVITLIDVAGNTVTLSWTADNAGTYSIERKTALLGGSWSTVLTDLPAGNQTTNFPTSGSDSEFYQVTGETEF